ncbi:serine/threonine-protein kinase/endoribonuclease IRE1-like [Xenia sp. Carnegie-2017]|uniref:serine/threonine-protein kinase/endoribonuclease IRE1-like n=1 Tax=Xenia sp. Carnegie-2017 TaxID=2897299 RepID=UPI001F041E4C|nr:serine/threonine-protein kinase/endoribonuclease IRE1-like [Xenia sp. Carnegie-2017]XP_046843902.1 serine/threonine-protein kinase/endoribonuclease IRE1-like [Xenia sp. Carnegie-2017]
MPYLHLYLEVDKKMRGIDLKPGINKIFDGNASEYIELRLVDPSDEIIIRPLSNMVHSKRDDEPNEESCGTLTLFSCKDGKHYALTCLHVGYGKILEGADQIFYIRDKIENDKLAFEKFQLKNKYSYTHENSIKIPLGELFDYSFDLETDIMAILIDDKENEFTAAEIEMPSSFDAVFDNLLSKENEKVYKVGDDFGLNVIADLSHSVFDNNKKLVFRDVVAVKSDNEFLRRGDSGCLVYYYDENDKKIPFAYGVAAVTKKNETYYVCMRLKDGLEKLGLLENVSFKDFSRASKKREPSVCQSNDNDSFEDSDAMPSSGINDEKSVEEGYISEDGKQRLEVQELLRQPWKCFDKSIIHQKKFKKMEEYGRKHPEEVRLLGELRVIFKEEFLIGKGSDGARVYLALGNNGYGKAVKRIHKDSGKDFANREKEIFNELNAKRSNYAVNFFHLEENLDEEYLYMILDLCEESLESYVKSSSLQDLQKVVPKVLIQILNGLVHLHSGERPILHRDLRPSNVLRDVQGNFLIADFGISHMLSDETSTHRSIQRGAKNWIAPESYDKSNASIDKARYKKESDIMNAGMLAYYVATKGKHPFGDERLRLDNILKGNLVGLDEIEDVTFKDLLSWMLQLEPEDRPSANEALKHPYLQSDEEKFNMLCDMGNQPEMKQSQGQSSPNSDVFAQLYAPMEWMTLIDYEVLKDFKTFEKNGKEITLTYKPTWASCLRFIRKVKEHWSDDKDKPRTHLLLYIKEGNYVDYFMRRFPELPLLVHKILRSTDWKTRADLQKHFTA